MPPVIQVKMLVSALLPVLLATAAAGLSVQHKRDEPPSRVLDARQAVVTPPPCEPMVPEPSQEEVEERFHQFAHAFLVAKNLTEAFEYISATYIVRSPQRQTP